MNRFKKAKPVSVFFRFFNLPILTFILMMVLFLYGLSSVNTSSEVEQQKSLTTALRRGVMQCYVIEGTYPESLEYLEEHYGLYYDTDKYFIDYQVIASNIMPDFTVIPKVQ